MLVRRVLSSEAQRKPGAKLGLAARAEVDSLLSHVTRADGRAAKLAA